MKKVTLRLTLDVTFESPDETPLNLQALTDNLHSIGDNPAIRDAFTEGTNAKVPYTCSAVNVDLSNVQRTKVGTSEHNAFVEALENVAEFVDGGSVRADYSGRGMYGAVCYGVKADNQGELAAEIGKHGLPQPKWDNMGLGVVAYWPGIEGAKNKEDGE